MVPPSEALNNSNEGANGGRSLCWVVQSARSNSASWPPAIGCNTTFGKSRLSDLRKRFT